MASEPSAFTPRAIYTMCWSARATSPCLPISAVQTRPRIAIDTRPSSQTSEARLPRPPPGLHFTPQILEACKEAGADIARVTLHVGLGTFQPLHSNVIEEVQLHHESFSVSQQTIDTMDRAQRIVAVGTTSVRAIESSPEEHETNLFIYPGFHFRRTGAMLTNFHLPQSSLLVLVCAFAGKELILRAYEHAVRERYRFFSYGDCMVII